VGGDGLSNFERERERERESFKETKTKPKTAKAFHDLLNNSKKNWETRAGKLV